MLSSLSYTFDIALICFSWWACLFVFQRSFSRYRGFIHPSILHGWCHYASGVSYNVCCILQEETPAWKAGREGGSDTVGIADSCWKVLCCLISCIIDWGLDWIVIEVGVECHLSITLPVGARAAWWEQCRNSCFNHYQHFREILRFWRKTC